MERRKDLSGEELQLLVEFIQAAVDELQLEVRDAGIGKRLRLVSYRMG